MRSFKQLGLLVLSVIGVLSLTACASVNPVYRTYYQDAHCKVFYVDANGERVYTWKGSADDLGAGRSFCNRDSDGRLYFVDSFGNRIYKTHCVKGCVK